MMAMRVRRRSELVAIVVGPVVCFCAGAWAERRWTAASSGGGTKRQPPSPTPGGSARRAMVEREDRAHDAVARVVHRVQSDYQDICVVEHGAGGGSDVRLLIDRELQFSSVDEYRYHEALVHPALSLASQQPDTQQRGLRVLLLGAGDGLAAREVLKYPAVRAIDIVDLDKDVTDLCRAGTPRTIERLVQLCQGAFENPRVQLHTTDALSFLSRSRSASEMYDVVIMDLPDPITEQLARLYTVEFFTAALSALRSDGSGILVTHGGDVFASRRAFWTLAHTLREAVAGHGAGEVVSYAAPVPSFGLWGFALACTSATLLADGQTLPSLCRESSVPVPCRFLSSPEALHSLFELPPDISEIETSINTDSLPTLHSLISGGNLWAGGNPRDS